LKPVVAALESIGASVEALIEAQKELQEIKAQKE